MLGGNGGDCRTCDAQRQDLKAPAGAVVVTGSSGFLGRHVVAALLASGCPVLAASRRPIAETAMLRRLPVAEDTAPALPPGATVIHLAEPPAFDPAQPAEEQAERRRRMLAGLLDARPARLIYASSAAVYGDRIAAPRREEEVIAPRREEEVSAPRREEEVSAPRREDEPRPPWLSPYAAAKLACEAMVLAAGGTVVRLANIYGPGQSPASVLSAILTQVLAGDGPVTLRDLRPIRDYLWVADAAHGLAALARTPAIPASGPEGSIFNLGSGTGTSVAELAALALTAAGTPGRPLIQTLAVTADDLPSTLTLDTTKITMATGWHPQVDLGEGIAALIAASRSTPDTEPLHA